MAADLVLFDPATVGERATIAEPHAVSAGIQTVWVNGEIVYDNGAPTGTFPGRPLRRGDARPQDSHASRPLEQRIDDFIRDEMRRQRIPGVAVAIVNKGDVTARGTATPTSSTWCRSPTRRSFSPARWARCSPPRRSCCRSKTASSR